jgi:hypothetical protein
MDIKALNEALQNIVEKRKALEKIDYNDPQYDDLEEELHDDEDDFQDIFGDYMEKALQTVHDEYCPDNDVLLPIGYLGQGVIVEVDKLPGKDTRLVLVPNPVRILLTVGKDKQQVVWEAK